MKVTLKTYPSDNPAFTYHRDITFRLSDLAKGIGYEDGEIPALLMPILKCIAAATLENMKEKIGVDMELTFGPITHLSWYSNTHDVEDSEFDVPVRNRHNDHKPQQSNPQLVEA
jgi:hypothetical protein